MLAGLLNHWRVQAAWERVLPLRHPWVFLAYLRNRWRHGRRRLDGARPLAVLQFNPRQRWALNEYLYATLLFFMEGGYGVWYAWPIRFRDYLALRDYRCAWGRWIYGLPQVKVADRPPGNVAAAIHVIEAAAEAPAAAGGTLLRIDFDGLAAYRALAASRPRSVYLPFPMFPPQYRLGNHHRLGAFRGLPRRVRMGFIGAADPQHYGPGRDANQATGKMPRAQIVALLRRRWPRLEAPATAADLSRLLHGLDAGVFVLATGVHVAAADWLATLARFDFFLCPPGQSMPMCHNLIESLAVGAIPITNYSDWLNPHLEHGVNALLFDSEDALLACLETAAAMAPDRIAAMRQAAGDFYDRHLSPKAFAAALRALDGPGWTIHVNAERTSLLPPDR